VRLCLGLVCPCNVLRDVIEVQPQIGDRSAALDQPEALKVTGFHKTQRAFPLGDERYRSGHQAMTLSGLVPEIVWQFVPTRHDLCRVRGPYN
jgi:hypothetical protein